MRGTCALRAAPVALLETKGHPGSRLSHGSPSTVRGYCRMTCKFLRATWPRISRVDRSRIRFGRRGTQPCRAAHRACAWRSITRGKPGVRRVHRL